MIDNKRKACNFLNVLSDLYSSILYKAVERGQKMCMISDIKVTAYDTMWSKEGIKLAIKI